MPTDKDLLERFDALEKKVQAIVPESPQRARGGIVAGVGSVPDWAKEDPVIAGIARTGLGADSDVNGTKFYDEVIEMLSLGSPRLALAKGLGVTFVPFVINIRGDFPSTDTTLVPDVGSDVKIVQDTLIDAALVRITNQSNIANTNVFQTLSDFFFNWQSGIEATLDVQGAPRYTVAETFTPLATLFDCGNGSGFWPKKWVMTYQQQLFMSFQASVTLPYAPLDVCVTFRAWVPQGDAFTELTNREALDRLAKRCGIVVTDAYRKRVLGDV